MAFAVTQLPGKPVVIVTLEVPVERYLPNFRAIVTYVEELIAGSREPLYVLIDAQRLELSFSDILIALGEMDRTPPGRNTVSRVRVVMVGTHPLIDVAIRRVRKQIDLAIDRIDTLEAALAFAGTSGQTLQKLVSTRVKESGTGTR